MKIDRHTLSRIANLPEYNVLTSLKSLRNPLVHKRSCCGPRVVRPRVTDEQLAAVTAHPRFEQDMLRYKQQVRARELVIQLPNLCRVL